MTITERWNTHPEQFWLRGEQPPEPVRFDAEKGIWHVYGHPDAQRVLADTQTFSSHTGRLVPEAEEFSAGSLTQLDPPRHTKLRKLVNQAFTPRVVAGLEPRITTVATDLLEAADRDHIDLVADFAYPLPVIVIAELLGVPSSDRDRFHRWVDAMLSRSSEFSLHERNEREQQELQESLRPVKEMSAYIAEHAARRRREPREDLLTRLVEAEVDGVRLTDQEVVNFANLLLIAGHITTTMLVGNTVMCLDAHPQERARVQADRSLVPAAIEESLRVLTPFPVVARVTNAETVVGGRAIGANQLVMVWVGVANRDPRQFLHPDRFSLDREPNPHLAFGRGIHFCVGAPLARLEGKVATNLLLDRHPHLRGDPQDPPAFLPTPNMTGARRLPVLLT
ncbi:MAG: cytochrome [Marmoricola sp.]|nr:cytochrome [Marmoricola sp.]